MEKSLMTSEEHQKLLQEKQRREAEAKAKAYRFQNRKSLEEILRKLLNGDIFDMFQSIRPQDFPRIPIKFEGHWEYAEVWEFLFTYEVYNSLLNNRRGGKDEMPNQAGIEVISRLEPPKKQQMWVGYCVCGPQQGYFQTIRMYMHPPHSKNIGDLDQAGRLK